MMTTMASKTRWQRCVLPGMPPTTIMRHLKATDQEFCELSPRCFLGILLASSPFAASPEDDSTAFIIGNTVLPACMRICWGEGLELSRPQLQTLHLLMAYFGHPFCQAYMYNWGDALEGGEGRDPIVCCNFHLVGHGFGGLFFCDGRSDCLESTLSMVQQCWNKTHKSFAKRQEKSIFFLPKKSH